MQSSQTENRTEPFVCPRTGKVVGAPCRSRWALYLLPLMGLASLIWFLIRVIPKPSRAAYPCQRVAAPLASGFVLWLLGMVATFAAWNQAKRYRRQARYALAIACLLVAAGAGLHTLFNAPAEPAQAAYSVPQTPNTPVGTARGIHPGRVVWVHDPRATDFKGEYQNDGHWWEARHTDQAVLDNMMSLALQNLTGTASDEEAWDAIFRHYNQTHGRGDVGYTAGEKITIKVNLVASANQNDGRVNLATYEQTAYIENVSVSPWQILALLRQLVYKAGVPQECIAVGDSMCFFPKHYWDACHTEFPDVVYLDSLGYLGRTKVAKSDHPLYWSKAGATWSKQDYVPVSDAEATYHINFANLKAHEGGGVTLCGKSYYGGLIRRPGDSGYYELHYDLPFTPANASMGRYRTLVDLLGHADFGGKAILYMHDGLWGGLDAGTRPSKYTIPPFNNDWPSSLLVSQDPMAIESVGVDLLKAAMPTWYPSTVVAADDYLHEGALADNPPSGTFYDPERDGVRMTSLGVHEHWNNNIDRKYSRNLGTGNGIELVPLLVGRPGDVNLNGEVDVLDIVSVVTAFGATPDDPRWDPRSDLDGDQEITVLDIVGVVTYFGTWKAS